MAQVEHDGASIYWESVGSGTPLMMVAGLGGVATYWTPQVNTFSQDHQVLLHDQRGTGRSSQIPVKSVEQMADDAVAVMNAAGIERTLYLGHSTGGAIGVALALKYPGRIAGLIINASTTHGDAYRHKLLGLRKTLLEMGRPDAYASYTTLLLYPHWYINQHHESLAADEARAVQSMGCTEAQASRLDAILNFDPRPKLKHLSVPTLVLCAKDDILTPLYFSEEYAALIPNAQCVILETGGHAASITVTAQYNQIVRDFFSPLTKS
ncbi:MAG: alpha/beta hydrolase [Burkholderiales bacterium]|jgi:aminoacrylate hydrolase|nr:alpha/beta hydrolase [Burkholderiales bacterium]MDP4909580.1 alpha/beta hydrolase [Burkholderiaceae bacterium]MDP4969163.1 alpha/beta hydrolase [Burkholderiaceae bacterium]